MALATTLVVELANGKVKPSDTHLRKNVPTQS